MALEKSSFCSFDQWIIVIKLLITLSSHISITKAVKELKFAVVQ